MKTLLEIKKEELSSAIDQLRFKMTTQVADLMTMVQSLEDNNQKYNDAIINFEECLNNFVSGSKDIADFAKSDVMLVYLSDVAGMIAKVKLLESLS